MCDLQGRLQAVGNGHARRPPRRRARAVRTRRAVRAQRRRWAGRAADDLRRGIRPQPRRQRFKYRTADLPQLLFKHSPTTGICPARSRRRKRSRCCGSHRYNTKLTIHSIGIALTHASHLLLNTSPIIFLATFIDSSTVLPTLFSTLYKRENCYRICCK